MCKKWIIYSYAILIDMSSLTMNPCKNTQCNIIHIYIYIYIYIYKEKHCTFCWLNVVKLLVDIARNEQYTGWTQKHSLISSSYKIKTYWNILTKLVATVSKTHTVSCGITHTHTHTHTQCAPLLLLGKHRCDNLARTRLSAAYPAWPTW